MRRASRAGRSFPADVSVGQPLQEGRYLDEAKARRLELMARGGLSMERDRDRKAEVFDAPESD
eukprot:500629-Hanusia_phi.AAC.2